MKTEPPILLAALGESQLEDLEQRFVEEYCVDLNHKSACIRCGIDAKKAAETGRRLMRNPEIMQAIDVRLAELSKHSIVNAEYVRSKLKEIVERCMQAVPVMEKVRGDGGKTEMIPTGEFKFDAGNANKALELIGKHLNMFSEKTGDDLREELKALTPAQVDARITRLMEEHRALTLEQGADGVYGVPAVPALPSP